MMTKKQINKLKFGCYRVWWKSGGYSVASLGFFRDGTRWLAPSNWITFPTEFNNIWPSIRKMTFICGQNNRKSIK